MLSVVYWDKFLLEIFTSPPQSHTFLLPLHTATSDNHIPTTPHHTTPHHSIHQHTTTHHTTSHHNRPFGLIEENIGESNVSLEVSHCEGREFPVVAAAHLGTRLQQHLRKTIHLTCKPPYSLLDSSAVNYSFNFCINFYIYLFNFCINNNSIATNICNKNIPISTTNNHNKKPQHRLQHQQQH